MLTARSTTAEKSGPPQQCTDSAAHFPHRTGLAPAKEQDKTCMSFYSFMLLCAPFHVNISTHYHHVAYICTYTVLTYNLISIHRPTSSSSLPSFSPYCSAGEPALTWLTKIPVRFPPTMVMSSARLALLCFGEVGGLGDGE